jgi:hypothetical protein
MACASTAQRREAEAARRTSDSANIDDPIKLLQANAPGASIIRTSDGGIAVNIMQPPKSFVANSGPLYLVDDAPFRAGPNGELTGISVYDIQSIKVLRRPEEVGVYGSRGVNGVVLIRLKKPGR